MFKLLVVAPVALVVVGILTYTVIGPVTLWGSTLITDAIIWLFETAGILGGAVYGLFYAPLVITGMHHMFRRWICSSSVQQVPHSCGRYWQFQTLHRVLQHSGHG